jgi:ribosomal protein S18 acetylase RimI-like enzyme
VHPLPPGFALIADPEVPPFDEALALVRLTDWHANIPEEVFRTATAHSAGFAVRADQPPADSPHALVAYARVVTDRATYAYLCDVIVHPGMRGRGLSHALVQATLDHPQIGQLRRYALLSRHAPELYRRHGFTDLDPAITYLERYQPMHGILRR